VSSKKSRKGQGYVISKLWNWKGKVIETAKLAQGIIHNISLFFFISLNPFIFLVVKRKEGIVKWYLINLFF